MTRTELQRRVAALSSSQRQELAQALAAQGVDFAPETRLVAFVQGRVESAEVLAGVRANLPPAMVPSDCVVLEELPRNANGKLDRAALPTIEAPVEAARALTPLTPGEELLAQPGVVAVGKKQEKNKAGLRSEGLGKPISNAGGHSLDKLLKTLELWANFRPHPQVAGARIRALREV